MLISALSAGLYPSIHQIKGWNAIPEHTILLPKMGLYPSIHQIKGWNIVTISPESLPPISSLSINPSNQGLKPAVAAVAFRKAITVSIHQSIKSRVETSRWQAWIKLYLCLYPSIHQIKGWNTQTGCLRAMRKPVSIHQSIKSRVETSMTRFIHQFLIKSLSINPSNQGLKPGASLFPRLSAGVSIHQSIKSRVETINLILSDLGEPGLYPSIHQIKGWNSHHPPQSEAITSVSIHQSIKSRVETLR